MTPVQWILIACVALGSLFCAVIVIGIIIGDGAQGDWDDAYGSIRTGPDHLRAGLQEIVAAADRLSQLDMADLYREGYVAAFRDARSMALKALNQGDQT